MISFLRYIIQFFYPQYCENCGKYGAIACSDCLNKTSSIQWVQQCHVCGKEVFSGFVHKECKDLTYLDGLINTYKYSGVIKKLIKNGKYKSEFANYIFLGEIVADYLQTYTSVLNRTNSIFVPIPLSRKKHKARGYNQAEIFGQVLSKKYKIVIDSNLLFRSKNTETQVGLKRQERKENLHMAFVLNRENLEKHSNLQNIILVDDVSTSGSTLNECAKLIKNQMDCSVFGICIARA